MKENESADNEAIDISDYFTTTNEKAGMWVEAKVNGKGTGIEFKVLGVWADEVMLAADAYDKEMEKVEKEKDLLERTKRGTDALVERVAKCVVGIRGKDGRKIILHGEPCEGDPESIREILRESPEIRAEILAASVRSENFMRKKS